MSLKVLSWVTLLIISVQPVSAQVVFQDDFSDTLEQWQLTQGEWSNWQIKDGVLEGQVEQPQSVAEIVPRASFWPSWLTHYSYELDYQLQAGVDRNLTWGYRSSLERYEWHLVGSFGEVWRGSKTQGFVWLQTYWQSFSPREWHHLKIDVAGARYSLWIDGQLVGTGLDPTYGLTSAGRVSLKVTSGAVAPTKVMFDNLMVRQTAPVGEHRLSMVTWRQTDPAWRDAVYDQADRWSPGKPSIARWGCALTSAAMVLQYHGYGKMPDESWLDPGSLNKWLQEQPDGYVGDGYLNWLAVSRLTKQLHDQHSELPVLEYSRSRDYYFTVAQKELYQERPVILQLPNHFVVATGVRSATQDLFISDPWYDYDVLSQHQTSPLSAITYTPSQTDLSYLLLVLPVELTGQLENSDRQADLFWEKDSSSEVNRKPIQLLQLAKPQLGEYWLWVSPSLQATDLDPQLVQFFSYSPLGEVTQHDLPQIQQGPLLLKVTVSSEGVALQSAPNPWLNLRQEWWTAYAQGNITQHWVYRKLDRLIGFAMVAKAIDQPRYIPLITQELSNLKEYLLPGTYERLLQILTEIRL